MPDKKINIPGQKAYNLGLIDKPFSGSVRRLESEVSAAKSKKTMPKNNSVQFTWSPNEPSGALSKKADAAFGMLHTINGTKPSKPSAQKPVASKPTTPKSNMKNFAIKSQERRDEYTRRGWAQDATTELSKPNTMANNAKTETMVSTPGAISANVKGMATGMLGKKTKSISAPTLDVKAPTSFVKSSEAETMAPKSRKETRQERRVARLEKRQAIQKEKGELALSEGRTMDAKQKRYRYNRLQERIDRNKNK